MLDEHLPHMTRQPTSTARAKLSRRHGARARMAAIGLLASLVLSGGAGAQTEPASLRLVTVAEAKALRGKGEQVRMRGTLLYETGAGWFCIHDGTGGIRGQIDEPIAMKAGDLIEITATPTDSNGFPWLWKSAAKNLGPGVLPTPQPFSAPTAYLSQAQRDKLDAQFVTVRGRVVRTARESPSYPVRKKRLLFPMDVFFIDDSGAEVKVLLSPGVTLPQPLLTGALVEVTGTCRLDSKLPTDQPGSIQLTVSGADRVRVLKWPPFWTWPEFQRWAGIVSAAAAAMFAIAAVWLWMYRKKVKLVRAAERNAELERALAKERELGEMKSNFVSLVSHEFRTPLGVIMSSTEVLQEYFDRLPAERRQRQLDMIFRSTKNLANLVEEVLLLGRVDEGRMQFAPAPLELEKICRSLADEAVSATGGACPILFTPDGPLTGASSDESLLRHILSNLLSNAVKYSQPGAAVDFTAARKNGSVVFTVRDRGIGIPPEDQARLFTSFTRGSNVGNRPGTGLGLVLVQKCVRLHGGTLDVQSAPGAGTTVTVTLPVFGAKLRDES